MKRINILDQDTFNKIAAGEVVERPFSVVKELVENSIDADSKNITIEIEEGGLKFIRITDDGHGIYPEDIEKAFIPHATSKIFNIEDIFTLRTMGFRGEALASISSVSKTLLKSRVEDFSYGKEICLEGGRIVSNKETGMNVGTTIEVEDLFYNVPARLKFMKSVSREGALISDIVQRLALANPHIGFKLYNNNKMVVNTYGDGNMLNVIRAIYGKNVVDNVNYFEYHGDISSVYGYIGNESISRGSRNNQSIFVNKRYIKSKSITTAVENAFKSFLTVNKFPFFVLFLDIYAEYVDVNVHPTKTEVKFKDDRSIFSTIFKTVHQSLKESLKDTFNIEADSIDKIEEVSYGERDNSNNNNHEVVKENGNIFTKYEGYKYEAPVVEKIQLPIDLDKREIVMDEIIPTLSNKIEENKNFNEINRMDEIKEIQESTVTVVREAKFPRLKIIGQFNASYILAQCLEDLFIVDQHAAHEKIIFEKYKFNISNATVKSQLLLSPVVLELTPEDFTCYEENKDLFARVGFNIEVFGDNTINIKEVPFILGKPEINSLFMDIIDNIKNLGSGETVEVKYNSIATLACKAAVKANDKLSLEEMEWLLEDLRYIEEPFTCPHGRPTIIKITLNELEKRFKRIQ
ncbi:DNA mismatch repair endonuclease MutL [Clostridium sp. MSJ-11]|uniref:DNA mismatch repair protein MutL n=1 Tax=Clostridium mobile TaxID=2841512 RepID=A0ABS6ECG7_9CLOT|nr:DNA mismatch repair endonuclease MutL [Clostridium mobile]MBU5482817.1 DNA mismatch repair endonuclease MutL [Clostridium mobile]